MRQKYVKSITSIIFFSGIILNVVSIKLFGYNLLIVNALIYFWKKTYKKRLEKVLGL